MIAAEHVDRETAEALAEALRPFAEIADRLELHRQPSPLWAVIEECRMARYALAIYRSRVSEEQP